jgi:hypothetical protein
MSVKACRQELPSKGVKLAALRAAVYAQNVRPSKHDATLVTSGRVSHILASILAVHDRSDRSTVVGYRVEA